MSTNKKIPIFNELAAGEKKPDLLYWVGCAGSFDPRAKKVTKAFVNILQQCNVNFAVLGNEESCTGDPARRAGNEFVFQMSALQNIETLNAHGISKIVCTCPHCFNTLKNEYPELGGHYDVVHHSTYLQELIETGKLQITDDNQPSEPMTYHDSCYIGRVNGSYSMPRKVLQALKVDLNEMHRCKSNGLCCGAGGAQMYKEDEPGNKRINAERIDEALMTKAKTIVANCPFCITMLQDGIKAQEKQEEVIVLDLAELIVQNNKW